MDRFKVDKITKLFGDEWTYEKRVSKCRFVMSITFGLVTVFTVSVISYFYWYSMEYAWHASREAIERPGLLDQESLDYLWNVFYVIAGLGILGLIYYTWHARNRGADNEEDAQNTEQSVEEEGAEE